MCYYIDTANNKGKQMKFKFHDKVVVTDDAYCCADLGTVGEIVDNGSVNQYGDERYLVRWESTPTMLWGVHDFCIKKVDT